MISTDTPRIRKQKCSGRPHRAYILWHDQKIYLGRWGSPESHARYDRIIAEGNFDNGASPITGTDITVAELALQYLRHCDSYYRDSNEGDNVKLALRPVVNLYGDVPASQFGPKALRACRDRLVEQGGSRKYVNKHAVRIRGAFRWAVAEELIPSSVYEALKAVAGLKRGRCTAREIAPVMPVPVAHVDAIHPYVSRQVWAMVELQQLSGARPGELAALRPIDLDTTGRVWIGRPVQHKTAHLGKTREIMFGPKCQEIIGAFLDRPVDAFLFSPLDAVQERHAEAACHRRADQRPNPVSTTRTVGDHYTTGSYRRAIHRACELANVPVWGPHRLRHTAGTNIRKSHGLAAAQVMLGHAHADTTEIYAEIDRARGVEVAAKVG